MGYVFKKQTAEMLRKKYKNSYIAEKVGLSNCYVSLIFHRKRAIPKRLAYVITKTINSEYEIEDLFELVRK